MKKQLISKKYFQMLAAMLTRPTSTALPRISTATSTRMATWAASIGLIARAVASTPVAMWAAISRPFSNILKSQIYLCVSKDIVVAIYGDE